MTRQERESCLCQKPEPSSPNQSPLLPVGKCLLGVGKQGRHGVRQAGGKGAGQESSTMGWGVIQARATLHMARLGRIVFGIAGGAAKGMGKVG